MVDHLSGGPRNPGPQSRAPGRTAAPPTTPTPPFREPPSPVSAGVPQRVAVEGPIGVGKTSLAQRLGDALGYALLLEKAEENPFLERFYQDQRGHALPTQLHFLLQRAQQLQALATDDLFTPGHIADYLMAKDRLFAELTLDDAELDLYQAVYDRLTLEAPKPDLVIYLQAPLPVLQNRIALRGRAMERGLDDAYLESLSEAYARFFHFYDEAPLLIVNAAELDWVHNDDHFDALLTRIKGPLSARQYFNPHPSLL